MNDIRMLLLLLVMESEGSCIWRMRRAGGGGKRATSRSVDRLLRMKRLMR